MQEVKFQKAYKDPNNKDLDVKAWAIHVELPNGVSLAFFAHTNDEVRCVISPEDAEKLQVTENFASRLVKFRSFTVKERRGKLSEGFD